MPGQGFPTYPMMPGMSPNGPYGPQPFPSPYPPQGPETEWPPGGPGPMMEEEKPFFGGLKFPKRRIPWRRQHILHHLQQMVGQDIHVATWAKEIDGTLESIYPDHILLQRKERRYHIRIEAIAYVSHREVENDG